MKKRERDPEPLVRAHADAEEAERVRVEVVAPEVHGLLERRAAVGGDEGHREVEGFFCWFPLRCVVCLRVRFSGTAPSSRRLHAIDA